MPYGEDDRENLNSGIFAEDYKKKILGERAKKFASEPLPSPGYDSGIEIIEFVLADERYGIEYNFVNEVASLISFTQLPDSPAFLSGITNIKGKIIPIINLKSFLGLPENGLSNLNKLIILKDGLNEFAVLVDFVAGAYSINLPEIEASLPALIKIQTEYLKGITRDGLIVLDAEKIINDKRIIINDEF